MPNRCAIQLTITNRLGLHARPAMAFVDTANAFESVTVRVRKGDESVDGTSIMEIMMLAATQGSVIEVVCEGERAEDCCNELRKLVERGFDEE